MNDQHHACILEAHYYLNGYNVQFKLALSTVKTILFSSSFVIVH